MAKARVGWTGLVGAPALGLAEVMASSAAFHSTAALVLAPWGRLLAVVAL
jgi:hypothetical protein